jgi:serine/threonine-protein kinase
MRPESPSLVGCTIGGRFKVTSVIGQGAMGVVYAAVGDAGDEVALKVLHQRAAVQPDLVARFEREAEVARRVRSPFVAPIVGAGRDRSGRLWIAFERLRGEGLDVRVKRERYLSFAEVAPIVHDALSGLVAAHEAGVIHRDIKPANLFIESLAPAEPGSPPDVHGERTRILDFGVSKFRARGRQESSLTGFDATLGSFAYMAPEQVRASARVDARADLYALGAVAFRALTGRLPFEGATAVSLIALKLDHEAPSLAEVTGDTWPAALERVLAQMMARDRDHRFPSAAEALEAWRAVCHAMGDLPRRPSRAPCGPAEDEGSSPVIETVTVSSDDELDHEGGS